MSTDRLAAPGTTDPREQARLQALRALRLLDEPVSEGILDIVRLAAEVCDVPFAAMNVVDADWQTSLVAHGAAPEPVPRGDALCNRVIASGEAVIMPDASKAPFYRDNPFVDGRLGDVRFYAAVPLTTEGGDVVGTLCTYDMARHELDETQVKLLTALGRQVMGIVQLRRAAGDAADAAQQLADQADRVAEVLASSTEAYVAVDRRGRITAWNPAAEQVFGYPSGEALGRRPTDLFIDAEHLTRFRAAARGGATSAEPGVRGGRPAAEPLPAHDRYGRALMIEPVLWPSADGREWHAFLRDVTDLHAARREREAAEERWRITFESAPVGMVVNDVTDPSAVLMRSANQKFCRMVRYDLADVMEIGTIGLTHPDDVGKDLAGLRDLRDGRLRTYRSEKRYVCSDGKVLWARVSTSLSRLSDGSVFLISQVEDITEARVADAARRTAESLLTIAFDHASNGIAIIGLRGAQRGRLLRVNPALGMMTGRDDLVGAPLASLLDAEGDPTGSSGLLSDLDRLTEGSIESFQQVCRLIAGGGHIFADTFVTLSRDSEGEGTHAMAQLRDVTRQRAHEEMLTKHATTDALTGLANRMLMRDRLEDEIDGLRASEGRLLVMLLDLDRFKAVNDTLGHAAGDELLRKIAEALVAAVPPAALVARLGGDEFLVIVPGLTEDEVHDVPRELEHAVGAVGRRLFAGFGLDVGVSVGCASTRNPGTAPEDLIRAADQDMYATKRTRSGSRESHAV